MKFALELKNVPFAKFTPRPLINVDHIGGGGGGGDVLPGIGLIRG